MLFKKKKNGAVDLPLNENLFARILEVRSTEVGHKYCINVSSDNYNLLYRDGRFLGMPCPFGGQIYPFSDDPAKHGSNTEKKRYNIAKVVSISNAFNVIVKWGTKERRNVVDPVTGEFYYLSARGEFYVKIDEQDAARSADYFYRAVLSARASDQFTNENLRDFLAPIFVVQIGAAIQKHIDENKISLETLKGLTDVQLMELSDILYDKVHNVFENYGLQLVESSCRNTILQGISVEKQ